MIKFFRKIRKNLLNEGKTTRYFKYAVGEVMLVVIGILIALQINNWNETRIDNNRAIGYLERIVDNLEKDDQNIKNRIEFWSQVSGFGKTVLDYFNTGEKGRFSDWDLLLSFFQASQIAEFITTRTTYDEITGAGELGLIQNIQIRNKIANYYTNSDNVALSERPQYREHVRGYIPIEVQNYIWDKCYNAKQSFEQVMVKCPSPIPQKQTQELLKTIISNESLIHELRYWMSTLKVASVIGKLQMNQAKKLHKTIQTELSKENHD